jgi:glycosidase
LIGSSRPAPLRYYVQHFGHAFPAQRNARVCGAVHDVMRFWLARGVDGFRVDAVGHLLKDQQFRDNPPNLDFHEYDPPSKRLLRLYDADLPEVHEIIAVEAAGRSIDLRGNESLVTELSAEADVPASVSRLGTLPATSTFKMHDLSYR